MEFGMKQKTTSDRNEWQASKNVQLAVSCGLAIMGILMVAGGLLIAIAVAPIAGPIITYCSTFIIFGLIFILFGLLTLALTGLLIASDWSTMMRQTLLRTRCFIDFPYHC